MPDDPVVGGKDIMDRRGVGRGRGEAVVYADHGGMGGEDERVEARDGTRGHGAAGEVEDDWRRCAWGRGMLDAGMEGRLSVSDWRREEP